MTKPPAQSLPALRWLMLVTTAWVAWLTFQERGVTWTGLFFTSLALGWIFVRADFGYSARFRHLVRSGHGAPLAIATLVAAVAAFVVVPLSQLHHGYFVAAADISAPLVLGAAMFGVGMQLANGCGSGTLYAAGTLSRRLLVALPFFCLGGVLGTLLLPPLLALPHLGPLVLGEVLGPWWGLAATELAIAAFVLVLWRGRQPLDARDIGAAVIIGGLAALAFVLSGQTWGITMGLTLWGAKVLAMTGVDLTTTTYWSRDGNRQALADPLLAHASAMMDMGMLLGAMLATAFRGTGRHRTSIGVRGTAGAIVGGLLMGIGARLSSGCNIGAFIGGLSSGSIHGLIWFFAALPGCWLGMRLRPWFGLDRPSSDHAAPDQVIQGQDTRSA